MSLSANFTEWCRLRGYTPKPAVYLGGLLDDMTHKDARIVRLVAAVDVAARTMGPQKYVVEVFETDTFHYPLGDRPKTKQQFLAAMIKDVMTLEGSQR